MCAHAELRSPPSCSDLSPEPELLDFSLISECFEIFEVARRAPTALDYERIPGLQVSRVEEELN